MDTLNDIQQQIEAIQRAADERVAKLKKIQKRSKDRRKNLANLAEEIVGKAAEYKRLFDEERAETGATQTQLESEGLLPVARMLTNLRKNITENKPARKQPDSQTDTAPQREEQGEVREPSVEWNDQGGSMQENHPSDGGWQG